MTNKLRLATLLLTIALVALACSGDDVSVDASDRDSGGDTSPPDGSDGTDPTDAIGDDEWVLVGGTIDGAGVDVLDSHPVTLRVSGSDGCNSFSGGYEVSEATLVVGDLLGTLIGCEPDIDSQAQHITGVLRANPTLIIDGDRLTLSASNGLGLSYRAT